MDPRQIAILKAAHSAGSISGNTPEEQMILDSLVSAGYLTRQDREPPFPGKPKPLPIYSLTALGLAMAKNDPTQI